MAPETFTEFHDVMEGVKYLPCVSVIMPFQPVMSHKTELEQRLKGAFDKVKKELMAIYPNEKAIPVLHRLASAIKSLNYSTHKKSIAIFVSPIIEKVYYLDLSVEEKIIIDESFEIRDLIHSKKETHKYMLAVLSGKQTRIFIGNTSQFIRIVSTMPDNIHAYESDVPERVANFSDPSYHKEVMLDKFLRHTDNSLSILLKSYPLPLFVMGTERTIGHFKKITRNKDCIVGSVQGNYEDASEGELRKAIASHVCDWKKVKQNDLLHHLDAARSANKLATGIKEVWKAATQNRGRLLVVEKNYMYPAHLRDASDNIYEEELVTSAFYIKDAVDDIIEKVLQSGGDVEFVDEGLLNDYGKIALIEYY